MRTTIDSAGRIVVPKPMRQRLGLRPGQAIELSDRDGRIELKPVMTPMQLKQTKDGLVAVPAEDLPPLTDEMVRDSLELVRR